MSGAPTLTIHRAADGIGGNRESIRVETWR